MANDIIDPNLAPVAPQDQILQQESARTALEEAAQQPLPPGPVTDEQVPLVEAQTELQQPIGEEPTAEPLTPIEEEIAAVRQAADTAEEKIKVAREPSDEEIEDEAAPIRQKVALNKAAQLTEQEEINNAFKERASALKEMEQAEKAAIVDPNRFYKNQSTFDKIRSGIGLFLMGLGGNLAGGYQIIQREVDKDIADQKLSGRESLIAANTHYKLAENELSRLSTLTKSKDRSLKANALMTKLQQERAKKLKELIHHDKFRDIKRRAELGEQAIDVSSLTKEERKRFVPGYGFAADATTKKAVTKTIEASDSAMAATNTIRDLLKKHGTREILDRGAIASEESTRRNLQLQLKELFNLGVLNGPDLELLNEFTGEDFFAFTTTDARKEAKLQGVEEYIRARTEAALKRANLNIPTTQGGKRLNTKKSAEDINDSNIKTLVRLHPKMSKELIIKTLKKTGKWAE